MQCWWEGPLIQSLQKMAQNQKQAAEMSQCCTDEDSQKARFGGAMQSQHYIGRETRIPGVCRPATLNESVSSMFLKRLYASKKIKNKKEPGG